MFFLSESPFFSSCSLGSNAQVTSHGGWAREAGKGGEGSGIREEQGQGWGWEAWETGR